MTIFLLKIAHLAWGLIGAGHIAYFWRKEGSPFDGVSSDSIYKAFIIVILLLWIWPLLYILEDK